MFSCPGGCCQQRAAFTCPGGCLQSGELASLTVVLILDRYYIQPQWVFDCVNARLLLPVEEFFPGVVLPPHLSPFVEEKEGDYVPPEKKRLLDLERGIKGGEAAYLVLEQLFCFLFVFIFHRILRSENHILDKFMETLATRLKLLLLCMKREHLRCGCIWNGNKELLITGQTEVSDDDEDDDEEVVEDDEVDDKDDADDEEEEDDADEDSEEGVNVQGGGEVLGKC